MQLSYLELTKPATSNAAHLCTSLKFLPPRGRVDFPSPWVLLTPVIAPPTDCYRSESVPIWSLAQNRLGSFHFCSLGARSWQVKKSRLYCKKPRGHVDRGPVAEQTTREAVGRSIRHLNGKPAPRLQACGWPNLGFSSPSRSQQIPHGAKTNQLNWDQPQLQIHRANTLFLKGQNLEMVDSGCQWLGMEARVADQHQGGGGCGVCS